MCRGVRVKDEWTYFCGIWVKNRSIVIVLAIAQFVVASVSLAQHVYSVVNYNKIFLCSFNESSPNAGNFMSADVIIFDFGLFHELIQVQECIANYLDGGYMRFLWCLGQMAALALTVLTCLCVQHPHPLLLWPQLIIQNAYCFGLMILTIATADKLLIAILHPTNPHLSLLILYFGIGTCTNHIFDYILWHYYWHEEFQYVTRTGKHVLPFWQKMHFVIDNTIQMLADDDKMVNDLYSSPFRGSCGSRDDPERQSVCDANWKSIRAL